MNNPQPGKPQEPKRDLSPQFPVAGAPVEESEASVPSETTDTELQTVFYRIQTQGSGGGLAVWLRYLFGYEQRNAIHPDSLLRMEVEEILAILRQERRNRARWRYVSVFFGATLGVILPFCMFRWHAMVGIGIYSVLLPLSFFVSRKVASKKHQAATATLSRFDDIRAVGPLAEALEFPHHEVQPVSERALIRLLPRLQASDASLLDVQ
ncbi:MAG: hypothetical protein JWN14_937, partial [Chthonomonadales bacterium]|nr:hypothetical protein [Chthonomonadales bacterium]